MKKSRTKLLINLLFLISSSAQGIKLTCDGGVKILEKEGKVIAKDNVCVVDSAFTIKSKEGVLIYKSDGHKEKNREIKEVVLRSDVQAIISEQKGQILADECRYIKKSESVSCTGDSLKFVSPKGSLTAEKSMALYKRTRKVIAEGNVQWDGENMRISGDVVVGNYAPFSKGGGSSKKTTLESVEFFGNVIVQQKGQVIRSPYAKYDMMKDEIIFSGHVQYNDRAEGLDKGKKDGFIVGIFNTNAKT